MYYASALLNVTQCGLRELVYTTLSPIVTTAALMLLLLLRSAAQSEPVQQTMSSRSPRLSIQVPRARVCHIFRRQRFAATSSPTVGQLIALASAPMAP